MLFESYIGAQKYRSGLLERYFAPVKGFLEELLGLFYGKIEPFYFRGARVKLEVGLAKGKKLYDKRASAAAKDAKREMDRAMKTRRNRYD